jgi:photosystem II stability/assembly factor-like uncharacterized protein
MSVLFRRAAVFIGIAVVPSLALAQSGWFWQNPLPQGNALWALATPDVNTSVAVGNFGTIVRTTDGGATWTVQSSGTTNNLFAVSFVDASTGWAVGASEDYRSGIILHTTDGGLTWTPQASPTTNALSGVDFVDAETGTAVGLHGTILHTTDGGATWLAQDSGTDYWFFGVSFVDQNTGWVVGGLETILHTTDGGATWTWQHHSERCCNGLHAVSFIDPLTGWAAGGFFNAYEGEVLLLHTTDGGENWTRQWSEPGGTIDGASFVDANVGTVVIGGRLYRTTDGGETWTLQNNLEYAEAISFVDANTGTAVGGGIERTTDGGESWSLQSSGYYFDFPAVSFVDANTGWVVGSRGAILRTTDGGATWRLQESGTDRYLYGVSFVDANTGWAVGEGPIILHTDDGGETWIRQLIGYSFRLRAVSFVDTSTGWVVGELGVIWHTTDGGQHWYSQSSGTRDYLFGVSFVDANDGWAVGGVSSTPLFCTPSMGAPPGHLNPVIARGRSTASPSSMRTPDGRWAADIHSGTSSPRQTAAPRGLRSMRVPRMAGTVSHSRMLEMGPPSGATYFTRPMAELRGDASLVRPPVSSRRSPLWMPIRPPQWAMEPFSAPTPVANRGRRSFKRGQH